jgi:hypothetical protein
MTVAAVRPGIEMQEAEALPGDELLVHTVRELANGAHAPVCLDPLLTRELHVAALQAICKTLFASEKGAY